MLFLNLFFVLLPSALAAPLPYVILPHTVATTVSATPASTTVISTATPHNATTHYARAPDRQEYEDGWNWNYLGNMQDGAAAVMEGMEEPGHQARDGGTQTAQLIAEAEAMAAEAHAQAAQVAQAEVAQTGGQIAMDNPALAKAAAAPQGVPSARLSEPSAWPVFGVQSLPRA